MNKPLNSLSVPPESRVGNHTRADCGPQAQITDADGYFVGLALSGGGSRSANFSAACMFELQRLGILQHVDCISAVSGGSLAGAYYCLWGDDWNPGNVQKRLTHSFASDLIGSVLMPWNMIAMSISAWDRSDILADSFERNLYSRDGKALTFADLRPDRPRLLINAAELQSGKSFVFCNERFDELNSDLSKYPVAHAVAASAAVPVLMHHVTLRDYSTTFKRYRHLLDGGIADNLGITSLVESYMNQIAAAESACRPRPYPHGIILIVVDAHTEFDTELDDKDDIGLVDSLTAGAGLSTTTLLNRVSNAALADIIVEYSAAATPAQKLREQIEQLKQTGVLKTIDRNGGEVRVIHLALSRVAELRDVPFRSFGGRVNSVATYFNMDATEAYYLYKSAQLLVQQKFDQPLRQIADELSAGAP